MTPRAKWNCYTWVCIGGLQWNLAIILKKDKPFEEKRRCIIEVLKKYNNTKVHLYASDAEYAYNFRREQREMERTNRFLRFGTGPDKRGGGSQAGSPDINFKMI